MFDAIIRLLTIVSIATAQATVITIPFQVDAVSVPLNEQVILAPHRVDEARIGVETSSDHVFAADVSTGAVLISKGAHDVVPIASLTKLVTAMVVLDQGRDTLDQTVHFLDADIRDDSHRTFRVGEEVTRRQALQALLIGSVNSAGDALARDTLGREQFVEAMNAKTRSMHLASPTFVDPTGISKSNQASAADVAAILTTALSYPEIREITEKSRIVIVGKSGEEYRINSTNLLLASYLNEDPYHIVGAKTGSLPDAGYSMAQVTRNPQGHEIVVVALAGPDHFSRYADIKLVTGWIFDTFTWNDEDGGN
ncbi:MAG: serine hydrolase [bacterium]|nr:serine hydrolase [bacterium]